MTDALLTPAQAAAFLGISKGTLYNWSSQRKIPVVRWGSGKRGGTIRFRREALERFATKHERRAMR